MTDDLGAGLHRLRRFAAGLRDATREASGRVPERTDGTDATGTVRVVVAPGALPESVDVDDEWRQALRPGAVGAAVVEAAEAAAERQREAWLWACAEAGTEPGSEAGTEPEFEADDRGADGRGADGRGPDGRGPDGDAGTAAVEPAGLDALLREALDAAGGLDAAAEAPPPRGVGTAAFGKVEVTISVDGLVSCVVDPSWASQRTGAELGTALAAAVSSARDDLARAAATDPVGRLRAIVARLANA